MRRDPPRHIHEMYLSCNSQACRSYRGSNKDDNGDRLIHKMCETITDEVNDVRCIHCLSLIHI